MAESVEMPRFNWLLLAVLFSACGRQSALPPDLFPETAANVWRRTALQDLAASDSPDPVPRTSVERLCTASYDGPGKIDARVYELSSPAVALDLVQRWRPSADTIFFYSGPFFVVVKWRDADRQSLQAFVRELEKRLAPH